MRAPEALGTAGPIPWCGRAALKEATVSIRKFAQTLEAAQAAEFDELQQHSDMLELDVSTASWYLQEQP